MLNVRTFQAILLFLDTWKGDVSEDNPHTEKQMCVYITVSININKEAVTKQEEEEEEEEALNPSWWMQWAATVPADQLQIMTRAFVMSTLWRIYVFDDGGNQSAWRKSMHANSTQKLTKAAHLRGMVMCQNIT